MRDRIFSAAGLFNLPSAESTLRAANTRNPATVSPPSFQGIFFHCFTFFPFTFTVSPPIFQGFFFHCFTFFPSHFHCFATNFPRLFLSLFHLSSLSLSLFRHQFSKAASFTVSPFFPFHFHCFATNFPKLFLSHCFTFRHNFPMIFIFLPLFSKAFSSTALCHHNLSLICPFVLFPSLMLKQLPALI